MLSRYDSREYRLIWHLSLRDVARYCDVSHELIGKVETDMLSRYDLREYRLMRNLSLRDVARYCEVSHELIGKVENGEVAVTKHNHDQIIKGINKASQAIADGTFDELKEIESQKIKEEREKLKARKEADKKPKARKTSKADIGLRKDAE